jgi:PST family polysaccharide transporter
MKTSYGPTVARSGLAAAFAKSIRYGLVFLVQAFLMNVLAPDEFGLMKYVTIILGIVNLITVAGINTAVIQKNVLDAREYGPLFTLNLAVCLILTASVFASAPLAARFFGEPELAALVRAGSSVVLLGGASTIHRSLLQREFRYGTLSAIEAASAVISSVVSVILAFKGFGAWALCWSLIAFHASSSVMCVAARRGVGLTFRGVAAALPLFWFGAGWTLLKLLDYLNTNLGNLLIGRFFGSHTLGAFTVAFEMASIPQIGLGLVMVPVALSAFSRMQDDGNRMKEAWLKLTFFTSGIVAIYSIIIALCARDLINTITLLKPDGSWDDAAVFLRYLSPLVIVYSWASYPGLLWTAKRKVSLQLVWSAAMLVTVAAAIALGSAYGPRGVCAALIIRAVATFPVLVYLLEKTAGITPLEYFKAALPSIVCGIVAAAVCAALLKTFTDIFPVHHAIRLVVCAVFSTMAYVAVMMLFWGKNWRVLREYFKIK